MGGGAMGGARADGDADGGGPKLASRWSACCTRALPIVAALREGIEPARRWASCGGNPAALSISITPCEARCSNVMTKRGS